MCQRRVWMEFEIWHVIQFIVGQNYGSNWDCPECEQSEENSSSIDIKRATGKELKKETDKQWEWCEGIRQNEILGKTSAFHFSSFSTFFMFVPRLYIPKPSLHIRTSSLPHFFPSFSPFHRQYRPQEVVLSRSHDTSFSPASSAFC